jgi:WD40 repeat protein
MAETMLLEGFWTAQQQTGEGHRDFEHNLALVIGINAYGNGIPSLTTAVNDAKQVAKILREKHGYSVHLLTDEVTLAQLTTVFEQTLPQMVGPQDRLLVYFAGHGVALDGDDGPAGYLVLQDSVLDDRLTFLPMSDLHNWLSALPCRHLLVVLDCCFAGAFRWASTRRLAPLPNVLHKERYDRFIQSPAWQVLTSAAYDQTALDLLSGDLKRGMIQATDDCHSPFAQAFFQALAGAGDLTPKGEGDGVITATELYIYLRDTVEVQADEQANHPQTPGLWPLKKHGKGEYIFLVPDHVLNLPPAPDLTIENNPYRGLQSYERRHAKLFFGRDEQVEQLAAVVEMNPLTVVVGASGTGKSSLVKAGLLPYLQPEESGEQAVASRWHILPPMRPGDSPVRTLENLLKVELDVAGADVDEQEHGVGQSGSVLSSSLSNRLEQWFSLHPGKRLLLVVDQYEELITICRDVEAREQFQQLLAEILQRHAKDIRIILTLRTDFESQFDESPLVPYWQAGRYIVPPMTQADLRAVIEGPASERVLYFDPPELVDRLIDEVIQTPGALPLLSFTLSEMYINYVESASDNRALTQEHYNALGGVIGSLRTRATQEYEQLPDDAHRDTMRRVMLRMVSMEGGELARRRVPLSELKYPDERENEQVALVLDRLVEARLLVRDSADVNEDGTVDAYVEPAHDALVRAWDKLLEWQREGQEYLPLQRRVTQAANEWKNADETTARALLWTNDPRLPLLQQVLYRDATAYVRSANPVKILWRTLIPPRQIHGRTTWLNATESAFVHESTQRRAIVWRRIVGTVIGTIIVLLGLTAFALYNQQVAIRNGRESQSQAIAAHAQQAIQNKDHDLAIALALAAIDIPNPPSLAVNALAAASFAPGTQVEPFSVHTARVTAVALSPDGQSAVSASEDGTVLAWNVETQEIYHQLNRAEAVPVMKALFSPTETEVLLGLEDGTLIVWNTASGDIVHQLPAHNAAISAMVYSADGQRALVGDEEGALLLWDLDQGVQLEQLIGQGEEGLPDITAVAISHDGQTSLAGTDTGQVRMWNLESGEERLQIHDRGLSILMVGFGPDDSYIFAAYGYGGVDVWSAKTGERTATNSLIGHTQGIDTITLAPDGTTMASGAWDGSVILWGRPEFGGLVHTLVGHRAPVVSLAYSQDGRFVLSGSRDGTVRLWDVTTPTLVRRFWVGPLRGGRLTIDTVDHIAVDSERRLALSATFDAVVLLNLNTGEEIQTFPVEQDYLASVAFSHDGQTMLTGQRGHLILVNLETDQELHQFHIEAENSSLPIRVIYGPDDKTVFAAFEDGTLSAWEAETERQLWEYHIPNTMLWSVAFSQDGRYAVSADEDKRIVLWDLQTGEVIPRFDGAKFHKDAVYDVALSADGKRLLSASADRQVILWDVETGQPIRHYEGHSLPVRTVAFGPDGKTILSGSEDRTVRLWDMETGAERFRFEGHSAIVQDVVPIPGNSQQPEKWQILSRDMRGGHILWQLPPTNVEELVTETYANRYVRDLTCDERRLYNVPPLCGGE